MRKELDELKSHVNKLDRKIAALADEGLNQQQRLGVAIEQLKSAIVEAHEREKKRLHDEIAELKKGKA
jgi:uncharacterized protein YydD (DUF2326 family)